MSDAPKSRPTAEAAQKALFALVAEKIADPVARCEILIAAAEWAHASTSEGILDLHARNMRSLGFSTRVSAFGNVAVPGKPV